MAATEPEELTARLRRFPADRYPVQHATTQFHLGSERLHAGDPGAALIALAAASTAFARAGMRLEQAKAEVMLGIGLRAVHRWDEAAVTFDRAEALLAELQQPAEGAAAAYNLGLVRQDQGDLEGACAAWQRARELFLAAGQLAQAAAAARDHGALLLAAGQAPAALPLLEQAVNLAERGGDNPGLGAAANVLGLTRLALGDVDGTVSALRCALGCFPRTLRPAEHAMVRANLAVAHEQAGDRPRARLAARQSLALAAAAAPVRAQAQQLLERLGAGTGDLWGVIDDESAEGRLGLLRDELAAALETPGPQCDALVRDLLDGLLSRPGRCYELAETLVQVVLELPPRPFGRVVDALVAGCAGRSEEAADRVRAVLGSGMARFALPQWQRLLAALNYAAQSAGQPAAWR